MGNHFSLSSVKNESAKEFTLTDTENNTSFTLQPGQVHSSTLRVPWMSKGHLKIEHYQTWILYETENKLKYHSPGGIVVEALSRPGSDAQSAVLTMYDTGPSITKT